MPAVYGHGSATKVACISTGERSTLGASHAERELVVAEQDEGVTAAGREVAARSVNRTQPSNPRPGQTPALSEITSMS